MYLTAAVLSDRVKKKKNNSETVREIQARMVWTLNQTCSWTIIPVCVCVFQWSPCSQRCVSARPSIQTWRTKTLITTLKERSMTWRGPVGKHTANTHNRGQKVGNSHLKIDFCVILLGQKHTLSLSLSFSLCDPSVWTWVAEAGEICCYHSTVTILLLFSKMGRWMIMKSDCYYYFFLTVCSFLKYFLCCTPQNTVIATCRRSTPAKRACRPSRRRARPRWRGWRGCWPSQLLSSSTWLESEQKKTKLTLKVCVLLQLLLLLLQRYY